MWETRVFEIKYKNKSLQKEFPAIFKNCDFCCIDLDRCLFPTYTEVIVGFFLFLLSIVNPSLWRHIPRLLYGGFYIFMKRLMIYIKGRPTNYQLLQHFSKAVEGIPIRYIKWCSKIVALFSYPGWRKVLSHINKYMPVHLLTFSIQPIASVYVMKRGVLGERLFRRAKGVQVRTIFKDGKRIFKDCLPEGRIFIPQEKLDILKRWMEKENRQRPLIIGHSPDELEMVKYARERGGLSIGFNPYKNVEEEFDVVVRGISWYPLNKIVDI